MTHIVGRRGPLSKYVVGVRVGIYTVVEVVKSNALLECQHGRRTWRSKAQLFNVSKVKSCWCERPHRTPESREAYEREYRARLRFEKRYGSVCTGVGTVGCI